MNEHERQIWTCLMLNNCFEFFPVCLHAENSKYSIFKIRHAQIDAGAAEPEDIKDF